MLFVVSPILGCTLHCSALDGTANPDYLLLCETTCRKAALGCVVRFRVVSFTCTRRADAIGGIRRAYASVCLDGPEAVETVSVKVISGIACSCLDLVPANTSRAPHSRPLMDPTERGEELAVYHKMYCNSAVRRQYVHDATLKCDIVMQ